MRCATAIGLEKTLQRTDNGEIECRTEKPITEATLIADGSSG